MKDSAVRKLQGFGFELSELNGMKKADVETVKSFITRRIYRASYGVNGESSAEHYRRFYNAESGFLRDITGNRCLACAYQYEAQKNRN